MKVLVAVEDKIYGKAIADFVANHKWSKDSSFKVLHVENDDEYYGFATDPYCCEHSRELVEEHKRASKALVLDVATQIQVALPGSPVEEQVSVGRARDVILQTAKDWHADLLILGSHGRSGFNRFLLGSVSLAVLSEAPCSVMIVRLPKEQQAQHEKHQHHTKAKKPTKPIEAQPDSKQSKVRA